MAVYNMSVLDNVTNVLDVFIGIGSITQGTSQYILGYLILVAFFIVFAIFGSRNDLAEVIVADSFITTILTVLFWTAGMVPVTTIIYPAVLFFIVLVLLLFSR